MRLNAWAALCAALTATPASAGGTPLTTVRVASGLDSPVYVTAPPGDFGRVFIVEQSGSIRILDISANPDALLPAAFLDISDLVTSGGEQGLLGLAFHPDYMNNGYFYVNYTDIGGDTFVGRYQALGDPETSNLADENSAMILFTIDDPFGNHNGGWMAFGPDGYLYIATGDGGGGNDPLNAGQDITDQLLGKMLRIDVNGDDFPFDLQVNYAIPADNPFVGVTGDDEIWAYGLRNPWRNAFDSLTGNLYIADVGQGAVEEVDFEPAGSAGGLNFGWRCMEGNQCTGNGSCVCFDPALTDPIHTYTHAGSPFRCSISGGEVYRGCTIADLDGTYFFADFCSEQIWSFHYNGFTVTAFTERTAELDPPGAQTIDSISSFGRDSFGELYICDLGGEVFKIIPNTAGPVADCNKNDVEDACDIASGDSPDVNRDGIPDECTESCAGVADCADLNADNIRDDACVWWACPAGLCASVDVNYADVGGAFGDCMPDGFANLFDRNQVLTCFELTNGCANLNIDPGGPFGDCSPDGNCNIFDVSHVLTAFEGLNPCTCPGGPQPVLSPAVAGQVTLQALADEPVAAGHSIAVRVFMAEPVDRFHGFQLHMDPQVWPAAGSGSLELVDIAIEPRSDAFAAGPGADYYAFSVSAGQVLAGLDRGSAAAGPQTYLATFTYRASADASGVFVIDVRRDPARDQTFLLAGPRDQIEVTMTRPALVRIQRRNSF